MGLNAARTLFARTKPRRESSDDGVSRSSTMRSLDSESYEPLASLAQEISRELGGDGLLVTWHEVAGEPSHLFASGDCQVQSETGRTIAEMGQSAAKVPGGGARSHWRTLADDPSSGVLTTSIPGDNGVLTIATLFKRVGRSTRMTAGESAARLLPLLQPFFRIWLSRLRTVDTMRALTAVIDDSDVGMLLLDRSGQIILSNSVASALMERGDGVRRRGAVVSGGSMTDTLRLHAAIEIAVAPRSAKRARPDHLMVALRREDAAPLMVAVVANAEVGSHSGDCAAILYIVDPEQDLHSLIEPVCAFFHLSPAETRLACHLVGGCSLTEAAAQLGVREQTARSYLKQVFLKTETNRQAELVRLLLLSAVRAGHAIADAAGHP